MSSLIGTAEERWSLARAIDALSESARQAGRPSLTWIVGWTYPSLTLGIERIFFALLPHVVPSASASAPGADDFGGLVSVVKGMPWATLALLVFAPCLGFAALPVFRLWAGLARLAPARAWREASAERGAPSLRKLWQAGDGLTLSTFGLWVQLAAMMAVAIALTVVPVAVLVWALGIPEQGAKNALLVAALAGPVVIVLLLYLLTLSVLTQLALHSLAHNRRGVSSALLHGWRIMRNDAWATVRTVVVDVVLVLTLLLIVRMISGIVGGLPAVVDVAQAILTGFAGVARAGYWARAYRALGGLSPDDGVPGL